VRWYFDLFLSPPPSLSPLPPSLGGFPSTSPTRPGPTLRSSICPLLPPPLPPSLSPTTTTTIMWGVGCVCSARHIDSKKQEKKEKTKKKERKRRKKKKRSGKYTRAISFLFSYSILTHLLPLLLFRGRTITCYTSKAVAPPSSPSLTDHPSLPPSPPPSLPPSRFQSGVEPSPATPARPLPLPPLPPSLPG